MKLISRKSRNLGSGFPRILGLGRSDLEGLFFVFERRWSDSVRVRYILIHTIERRGVTTSASCLCTGSGSYCHYKLPVLRILDFRRKI